MRLPRRSFPGPGCPFCAIRNEGEESYVKWFLMENYGSPSTLKLLERSVFCPRHRSRLERKGMDSLSSTFDYLTRFELTCIEAFSQALERERRARPGRPRPVPVGGAPPCPACAAGETAVEAAEGDLIALLEDEAGRQSYASREGLCRGHLWALLRVAPREVAAFLAEDAGRRLRELAQEFERYFELLDYRRSGEPKGIEQTAWRRGLDFFWGEIDP